MPAEDIRGLCGCDWVEQTKEVWEKGDVLEDGMGSWREVVIHERKMRRLMKDTHALVLVRSLA